MPSNYTRPGSTPTTPPGEPAQTVPVGTVGVGTRNPRSETTTGVQYNPATGQVVYVSQSRYNDPSDPRYACRPSDVGKVKRGGDNPPPTQADTLDNLRTLLAAQIDAYAKDMQNLADGLKKRNLEILPLSLFAEAVKTVDAIPGLQGVGTLGSQLLGGAVNNLMTASANDVSGLYYNLQNRKLVRETVLQVISSPSYTYKADDGIDAMETCQYPATVAQLRAVWGPLQPATVNGSLSWVLGGLLLGGLLLKKKKEN